MKYLNKCRNILYVSSMIKVLESLFRTSTFKQVSGADATEAVYSENAGSISTKSGTFSGLPYSNSVTLSSNLHS